MEDLDLDAGGRAYPSPVFITGGCGFIGSALASYLKSRCEIHILCRTDTPVPEKGIHAWTGDVRQGRRLKTILSEIQPRLIFHLASTCNVDRNLANVSKMYAVNVGGTQNLVAAARQCTSLERMVHIGTCEEYGNAATPFVELQREQPVSAYSASKVAATYFCQMMQRIFNFPVVILRPFLTYGPNQSGNMLIPALIAHCLEGRDFPMTTGLQTREINYISDIIRGIALAALAPHVNGEVINLGCGEDHSVMQIARKILELMGNPIDLLPGAIPVRGGESQRFYCSNEKALRLLGWSPKVSWDEGLNLTTSWYKKNLRCLRNP